MKSQPSGSIEVGTKISTKPWSEFYGILSELGRGKFAVVKRCRHSATGAERAAKIQRKRRKAQDGRADILHEIKMLEMIRGHPNVIELFEVFENNHEIIIVTEFVSGGELGNYLTVHERLTERETLHVVSDVLAALVFFHDKSLVHMDLKPQNLLLDGCFPECRVKLCDFGLMRSVDSSSVVREIIGTPDYVAPEVLDYEPLRTACDIWSLGVLVYVLLTGFSPFSGETKQEMYLNISQVNLDFPAELFASVSSSAVDFLKTVLVRNPSIRPSARDCLAHSWLNSNHCGVSSSVTSSSSVSSVVASSCPKASVDAAVDVALLHPSSTCLPSDEEHTPRKRLRRSDDPERKEKTAEKDGGERNKENVVPSVLPFQRRSRRDSRHGNSFRIRSVKLQHNLRLRRAQSLKQLSSNLVTKSSHERCLSPLVKSTFLSVAKGNRLVE